MVVESEVATHTAVLDAILHQRSSGIATPFSLCTALRGDVRNAL